MKILLFKVFVYLYLLKKGKLKWYSILVAQAIHETGRFTSSLWRNANNAYGMKYTGNKFQAGKYEASEGFFARYRTPVQSFLDRMDWHTRLDIPLEGSGEAYILRVSGVYAEDPIYSHKWRQLIGEGKKDQVTVGFISLAMSIIVAVLLFMLFRRLKRRFKKGRRKF